MAVSLANAGSWASNGASHSRGMPPVHQRGVSDGALFRVGRGASRPTAVRRDQSRVDLPRSQQNKVRSKAGASEEAVPTDADFIASPSTSASSTTAVKDAPTTDAAPGTLSTGAPESSSIDPPVPGNADPASASSSAPSPFSDLPDFLRKRFEAQLEIKAQEKISVRNTFQGRPAVQEGPKVPRTKKAAPRKLGKEDRATAPWGWEAKGDKATPKADLAVLARWLAARGLPQQKAELRNVKEGGRGLVATANIGKGETLLFVPERLLITPEKVYSSAPAGPILRAAAVPDWPALATFLLLEAAKGEESQWSTYIATLPRTPPCILQWSAEEVDVLLEGSPTQRKAIECIADVTSTFQDLDSVVFSKHRNIFPEEIFTLGLFKWAFAVLFSRLVRLPSLGDTLALVPWADMLNHRCEIEACLDYDNGKGAVVIKTDRAYSAGKEVFASYGPRSNGSLLLAYGVVPNTRNPHDSVDVLLGLDPMDPLLQQKQDALQRNGVSLPAIFPLTMEGWPSQLLAFVRLSAQGPAAPSTSLHQLASQVARPEAEGGGGLLRGGLLGASKESWPLDVEIRAREALLASCQVALGGYRTSLEEDEAVLAGILEDYLEDDGEQRVRVLAAAALRASERRILLKTEFVLRTELRELRAQEAAAREGKVRVELGNNLGGERAKASFLDRILAKIARP